MEENAVNKGFDAINMEGKKVEIKTRRTPEGISKVIFRSFYFDYYIYVELNKFYEPIQFLKIEINELVNNLEKNYKRLSVSKIKKIKSTILFLKQLICISGMKDLKKEFQMNRLIIIGNGFDLAHGYKTSYHDFILYYLKDNCIKAINEGLKTSNSQQYKELYHYKNELSEVTIERFYDRLQLTQDIINTSKIKDFVALADNRGISFNYFFKILEIGVHKFTEYNWVDFEIEYFKELTRIKTTGVNIDKYIRELNIHFDKFKALLESYLKEQQSLLNTTFDRKLLCDCFCEDILDIDVDVKTIGTQPPKRLLFINFNYTNTLEPYVEECRKRIHSDVNYIHGSVNDANNPPIFGFGDEFDKRFKEFEDEGNNELFKHIKSFGYLKTNNYSNLTRFLEIEPFQVQVYGHSCGLSDRTMFKEIFEHQNCLSIKIFYHQKEDGSDDYTEKTYELYRHFTDKNSMRKKIVDKQKSSAMPQPII